MKILAFGAHPDDIEPQIGGTLAKYVSRGADVTNVIITSTSTGAASNKSRDEEGRRAASTLGASYLSLGMSQNDFQYNRESVSIVSELIDKENPQLVFCVSNKDSHQDHQIVANIVKSATRKNTCSLVYLNQAFPGGVASFPHNFFSDITGFEQKKIESIMCFESQIVKYGEEWLESIIARDKYWGFNFKKQFVEVGDIFKWLVC